MKDFKQIQKWLAEADAVIVNMWRYTITPAATVTVLTVRQFSRKSGWINAGLR